LRLSEDGRPAGITPAGLSLFRRAGAGKGKGFPPRIVRTKSIPPEFQACHAEPGSLNDAAVSPNFAGHRERACAREFLYARQNRFPRTPLRGACGVVDRPAMTSAFRLSTRKETTMITLYDHIQELRAELRGCRFTRRERAAVEAELAKAVADQAEVERAFDQALAALDRAA
jgi:hypothetical protein